MHMTPVRKTATVTVSEPVDGMVHRRQYGRRRQPPLDYEVRVHSDVMAAARRVLRPGQRLVIIDAATVRLVNG